MVCVRYLPLHISNSPESRPRTSSVLANGQAQMGCSANATGPAASRAEVRTNSNTKATVNIRLCFRGVIETTCAALKTQPSPREASHEPNQRLCFPGTNAMFFKDFLKTPAEFSRSFRGVFANSDWLVLLRYRDVHKLRDYTLGRHKGPIPLGDTQGRHSGTTLKVYTLGRHYLLQTKRKFPSVAPECSP